MSTVPLTLPDDQDPLGDDPTVLQTVTAFVGRSTPLKVMGAVGSRYASIRVGPPGKELHLHGNGDTRLHKLLHLEVFLVKALAHVRLAIRDEADHIEQDAAVARRVEVTDDEAATSLRSAS